MILIYFIEKVHSFKVVSVGFEQKGPCLPPAVLLLMEGDYHVANSLLHDQQSKKVTFVNMSLRVYITHSLKS